MPPPLSEPREPFWRRIPGLLLARTCGYTGRDFCPLEEETVIGRNAPPMALTDRSVSKRHLRIDRGDNGATIEDLGSRNGTFLNSTPLDERRPLYDGDIIRMGHTLLVFHTDIREMLDRPTDHEPSADDLVGRFHTPLILRALVAGARPSSAGTLITGPTGVGKSLAARTVAALLGRPMVSLDAADFATEAAAARALFGEGDRPGALHRDGEVLHIDSAHRLPDSLQADLARVIAEGAAPGVGAPSRPVDIHLVLATDVPRPDLSLDRELTARLCTVSLPPLVRRAADIPDIFDHLLIRALEAGGQEADPVLALIDVIYYQALMLDGFEANNILGLRQIADRITSLLGIGADPRSAVANGFSTVDLSGNSTTPTVVPPPHH